MQNVVYPQGSVTVILAANESIAVATAGETRVYQNVGYPNFPTTQTLLGTVIGGAAGVAAGNNNGQTVFGPYTSGASITIDNGPAIAYYEVGASPAVLGLYDYQLSPTPVAVNATGAVSVAAIIGGIVTSTTAAAVAGTIPTGTVMDASSDWAINDSIDWSVINTGGANAFTVTAATGHTIVGAAAVAASTSGRFRTVKTAANTFITYRLA
jgi:hypothetical protein